MEKTNVEIEIDDWDFGFTTLSEEDLKTRESVVAKQTYQQATSAAKSKLDKMYDLILPLLNNLAKDADKNEYIKWPNRATKISEFIVKLNAIRNSS